MKKLTILALFLGLFVAFQAKAAVFDNDLYFGLQGNADVSKLQEFLTSQGVYSGPVSGNFFSLTLAGVKAFQAKAGISPAAGYFGPLTRSKANELAGADVSASDAQAVSETGSAPAPAPSSTEEQKLQALLDLVSKLQAQLNAQAQTNNTLTAIQGQLQAVASNTTPIAPPPAPAPVVPAPSQNLGVSVATTMPPAPVPPTIRNNIINFGQITSTSIQVWIDKTNDGDRAFVPSVFDTLSMTVHCDLVNSPDCTFSPQTFDATNNTNAQNPITIGGMQPGMLYGFDFTAVHDGLTVSSKNSFGNSTPKQ